MFTLAIESENYSNEVNEPLTGGGNGGGEEGAVRVNLCVCCASCWHFSTHGTLLRVREGSSLVRGLGKGRRVKRKEGRYSLLAGGLPLLFSETGTRVKY